MAGKQKDKKTGFQQGGKMGKIDYSNISRYNDEVEKSKKLKGFPFFYNN